MALAGNLLGEKHHASPAAATPLPGYNAAMRRKREPSWARFGGMVALLILAWIGWKSGLFNAIAQRLVNHSIESMREVEREQRAP